MHSSLRRQKEGGLLTLMGCLRKLKRIYYSNCPMYLVRGRTK